MSRENAVLQTLLQNGVEIPHPSSVFVDGSVNPDRIAPGVLLCPGTRLSGSRTSIGPGCRIGTETPATLDEVQLGHGVELKGGFFQDSVFLDGASMGSAAHVRPGCLLEEEANGAHAVGLKQTILLPFVTLGSLINFCDVLMAGGTSRRDHSEVGSSFIHFNFTPHGDKATASLIGDVPRGVLLNQPPIFLGGQGGLVGPVQAEYGTVLAAGSVARRALGQEGHLVIPGALPAMDARYDAHRLGPIRNRVKQNLAYLGNLAALSCWYVSFRLPFMEADPYRLNCFEAVLRLLAGATAERVKRLGELAKLVAKDGQAHSQARNFEAAWPEMKAALLDPGWCAPDEQILRLAAQQLAGGLPYLDTVQNFDETARELVSSCLQQRVDRALACASLLEETN